MAITRKTLALRCGGDVSTERIRKNERAWGLDQARCNTGNRTVLYDERRAIEALKKRRLV